MSAHCSNPQGPQKDKGGLSTTQDWKSSRRGRAWTVVEHGKGGPTTERYRHTYIVQLVVEPTGVTDGIAVGISPPQGGGGGLAVRAGRARPPGCRLREGGDTGGRGEGKKNARIKKVQSAKSLRKKTSTMQD